MDISGQFLVFPDDPHHGGLRAPASVNVWQAGWRFVCSPWNIHPHSPTSHCSKQLLHDIQKQVREEPNSTVAIFKYSHSRLWRNEVATKKAEKLKSMANTRSDSEYDQHMRRKLSSFSND